MHLTEKINVLMITGVYYPEINGAVLQCMQLIRKIGISINFSVLTGASNKSFAGSDFIEGRLVTRIFMPKEYRFEYIIGTALFYIHLLKVIKETDLVHIHGFSKRNAIVIAICRILNKKVIMKMTSYGRDDPLSIKNSSYILWNLFKFCNAYIGLNPAFELSYIEAGLPKNKYNFIPNSVDLDRYSPVIASERKFLREKYGFDESDKLIIFVGHFSPEKRPMLLYKAWVNLNERNICAKIIFIGRTKNYYEVDNKIVEEIRNDAFQRGILSHIHFVEKTQYVDEYMKIADVFVLPSIREGLPNVLLEAMACSLPCIVSDLPGVTNWLVDDGETGVLFRSDQPDILADKIAPFIAEHIVLQKIGLAARHFIERKFSCASVSQRVFDLYKKSMGHASSSL